MAQPKITRRGKNGPTDTKQGRGPGRPSSNSSTASRTSILRAAYKLARTVPLQDLSIVMVARALDITPALVHYYVGGRDWLTSGIMNIFYRDLLRKWPQIGLDWEENVAEAARICYHHFVQYGGVASYAVSNSRFRVYQLTAFADRDYGVEVLDRFVASVRSAGRSAERTGLYAHLMMEFVINSAHATVRHLYPGEHSEFLREKTEKLDEARYPNILFARGTPLMLDATVAFEEGLRLFILGLRTDPVLEGVTRASPKRARKSSSPAPTKKNAFRPA